MKNLVVLVSIVSTCWFQATCENGSKITAYSLECDQGQGDGRFYEVYAGLQRQFRASRLNASTRYVFRLAAINSLGKRWVDMCIFVNSGDVQETVIVVGDELFFFL